jgi:hypothetical protein
MPMVAYWKTKEAVAAMVTKSKEGALIMKMEGEQHAFPGYPRGNLLFGTLSKLKHEIKNQVFNQSWKMLQEGRSTQEIAAYITGVIASGVRVSDSGQFGDRKYLAGEKCLDIVKYDMVPPQRMVMPVREIWNAFEAIEKRKKGSTQKNIRMLKEMLTYIIQEDDAYRFRLQWLVQIFNPSAWWFKIFFRNPVRDFEIALEELENAEVVKDMKLKIKLFRTVLIAFLKNEHIKKLFTEFCREVDWNKVKMSEADKYHFRGKWFKVDLEKFEY